MHRPCVSLPPSFTVVAVFLLLASPLPGLAQQPTLTKAAGGRVRVERADQLPLHAYAVRTTAVALLRDQEQFAALAQRLQADLLADLAAYEIQDRATLKSYYGTLSDLALIRADYGTAVAYQDSIHAIEDKPGLQLTTGIVERAMLAAARPGSATLDTAAFRPALRREIAAVPYATV